MTCEAYVCNLARKATWEHALHCEIPFFLIAVPTILLPRLGGVKWGGQLGGENRPGEIRHGSGRYVKSLACTFVPVGEVVHLVWRIKHPKSGTDDRFPVGSSRKPRDSQPRREILVVGIIEWCAFWTKSAAGNGHNGLAAKRLFKNRVVFPSQPVIERETGARLPGILSIAHDHGAALAAGSCPKCVLLLDACFLRLDRSNETFPLRKEIVVSFISRVSTSVKRRDII